MAFKDTGALTYLEYLFWDKALINIEARFLFFAVIALFGLYTLYIFYML